MLKNLLFKLYARMVIYQRILKCRPARRKKEPKRGRVFILSAGGIGDAIISAQAYKALVDHYVSMNKEVYLVTDSSLQAGLRMVLDTEPGKVHWITCSFLNGVLDNEKLAVFKEQIGELSQYKVEQVIIMSNIFLQYMRACYVAACLNAKHVRVGLYDQYPQKAAIRIKLAVFENVFYKVTRLPVGLNEAIFWRSFIHEIDKADYRITIPYIRKQSDYQYAGGGKNYLLISVDSSSVRRRWPVQRYIELIRGILEKTRYDIVLTGSNVGNEIIQEFSEAFHECSRVCIMIKELGLKEWVELIRGAQCFIGVDSGGIHVSAAIGTQAFCLAGAWDGHRFYPYPIEADATSSIPVEPICIYRKDVDVDALPCANCCSNGGWGYGNRQCEARCKKGEPCQCLLGIMPDDVLATLEQAQVFSTPKHES